MGKKSNLWTIIPAVIMLLLFVLLIVVVSIEHFKPTISKVPKAQNANYTIYSDNNKAIELKMNK
jgi:hypothetical protein